MLNHTMMTFSITPIDGGWRWATIGQNGRPSNQGVVATKALAAALIIRDIVRKTADAPPAAAAKVA